ncbi:hypothetical protein RsS62_46870 [Rhizobium dioscoreae]|nr:hypothetical protein RsS62_46870 [Rhizobium dioscoreae]
MQDEVPREKNPPKTSDYEMLRVVWRPWDVSLIIALREFWPTLRSAWPKSNKKQDR